MAEIKTVAFPSELISDNGAWIPARHGDFKYLIASHLSVEETIGFIRSVMSNVYDDDGNYAPFTVEMASEIEFLQRCTNIEVPTITDDSDELVVDVDAAYEIAKILDFERYCFDEDISIYSWLQDIIYEQIDFQNKKRLAIIGSYDASTEALEAVSNAAYMIQDVAKAVLELVEKNGNKISKVLTNKKINSFINDIQKQVADSILAGQKDDGDV